MDAPTKQGQASSVAPEGRDLASALQEAFKDFIRPQAATSAVLAAAFDAAKIVLEQGRIPLRGKSGRRIILIDKEALVSGIIRAGKRPTKAPSTAGMLVDWMKSQEADLRQFGIDDPLTAKANLAAFNEGCQIIPSRSLRRRVFPRAIQLAGETSGRNRADTRHLIFALLEEPPETLHAFGELLTEDRVAGLKDWLADQIIQNSESGEDADAWRRIGELDRSPESVGTLGDAPAVADRLGRQAFAEVLAARIKDVHKTLIPAKADPGGDAAFILHIDGPWGSGKSSILNFLRHDLKQSNPPWLVVEFNAWRNQDRKPAWWPLIVHVGQAVEREGWLKLPAANLSWLWWNVTMRVVPLALTTGVVILAIYYFRSDLSVDWGEWGKAVDALVKGLVGLTTLAGLVWTASRTVSIGSKSAAQAYVDSNAEPYRRIVKLFERLVRRIGRPVALFIDDIDRCNCDYVIELLEGIQTLLRSAPVVYVVAGDRNWICSSFEKRYADFGAEIGLPGRPLGHLFLDKVFQLSTSIPRLSVDRQREYWRGLLERGNAVEDAEQAHEKAVQAEKQLEGKVRHEELQDAINAAQPGLAREIVRAAAAKRITGARATRATEHRLEPLAHLLELNPRAMKRLVNAYGLNQARAYLEGRDISVEALARWTIIELRWPLLAHYLAANWTDIEDGSLAPDRYPDDIRALLSDSDVRDVFGREGDAGQLTRAALEPILG